MTDREELLRVATALWASQTCGDLSPDKTVEAAIELIQAVDAKVAELAPKQANYVQSHDGSYIPAGCIRVKPEPVAWKFHFRDGGYAVTSFKDSYEDPSTPLYEPEDA